MSKLETINIKGKQYATVGTRLEYFREQAHYKGWGLITEVVEITDTKCVLRAVIKDPDGRIIATGIGHEVHESRGVNSTSYVENCETSAWGRALGNLGIGLIEGNIATAEEVANAIEQQERAARAPYDPALNEHKSILVSLLHKHGIDPKPHGKSFSQDAHLNRIPINELDAFIKSRIVREG